MRHLILVFLLAHSNFANATKYYSQKDGNFDNPSTWKGNKAPKFDRDTIIIHHSIHLDRKNDTFGNYINYNNYQSRIEIKRDGVFCLLAKKYTVYSIVFIVEGQMYCASTTFWHCSFNVPGYFLADKETSLHDSGLSFNGYGFALDTGYIDFDCNRIIAEYISHDTICPSINFVALVDTWQNATDNLCRIICFSNRRVKFSCLFENDTINSNSDSFVIYNRHQKERINCTIKVTDSCDRIIYKSYVFDFINSAVQNSNKKPHDINISQLRENKYLISSVLEEPKCLLVYNLSSSKILEFNFTNIAEIDLEDFPKGLYVLNIFDKMGHFIYYKKIMKS